MENKPQNNKEHFDSEKHIENIETYLKSKGVQKMWNITKDMYDKKHQEYYDKKQLLNIEIEEHTTADFDFQTTIATVFSLARRAKEIFEGSEIPEKRAFINFLVQNPIVQDKKLSFELRKPFNLVLNLAEQSKKTNNISTVCPSWQGW